MHTTSLLLMSPSTSESKMLEYTRKTPHGHQQEKTLCISCAKPSCIKCARDTHTHTHMHTHTLSPTKFVPLAAAVYNLRCVTFVWSLVMMTGGTEAGDHVVMMGRVAGMVEM
mmetsp:Transcript_78361/g.114755  ORF Transcript_78361/g.114755 Transcript_78361/m.114755 type:complete len:112 (+) Transcript_78361:140-475(+)